MVRGLLILNTSASGYRDLWWPFDARVKGGYNVYRAIDAPTNWTRISAVPVPGQYFRDQTTLQPVQFTVTPDAWVDTGQFGMRCFNLPETPYSRVTLGRPMVASHPDDVSIQITYGDGTTTSARPAMLSGIDRAVFLQVGESLPEGGAVSNFPVIDFDTLAGVTVTYNRLVNYIDTHLNYVRTFYTVVPLDITGRELHAPGAPGSEIKDAMQVDEMDFMYAEMVRRNAYIFEQAGEPAYLMFRRTGGTPCGCTGGEDFSQGRTACPSCFETGVIGGYYGPLDILFCDPDVNAVRTITEGGVKVERQSRSYLGPYPRVMDGDLIVRKNGERLVIVNTVYKQPRGVLLQQDFDVQLLPTKDVRYLIPVDAQVNPAIFNPVCQPDPGNGAQPVYQESTIPGKHPENPNLLPGRTVTFARIKGTGYRP